MFIPPAFKAPETLPARELVDRFGFAILLMRNADGGNEITHLPMIYEETGEGEALLLGHVARANPISKLILAGGEATAIFTGPHSYISPDWYESENMVPTWNYAAAHFHGPLTPLTEPDDAKALLAKLSGFVEAGLEPKQPWTAEKMAPGSLDKMLRGIVAFSLPVERVELKAKLSQNRAPEDRAGVIEALKQLGDANSLDMAELMQR